MCRYKVRRHPSCLAWTDPKLIPVGGPGFQPGLFVKHLQANKQPSSELKHNVKTSLQNHSILPPRLTHQAPGNKTTPPYLITLGSTNCSSPFRKLGTRAVRCWSRSADATRDTACRTTGKWTMYVCELLRGGSSAHSEVPSSSSSCSSISQFWTAADRRHGVRRMV